MTHSLFFRRVALLSLLYSPFNAFGAPGDLDPTFGTGGIYNPNPTLAANFNKLALQRDGKVVVACQWIEGAWFVARYTHDGKPDFTFSGDGWTTITPGLEGGQGLEAVAIQPDGKIVLGGAAHGDSSVRLDFAIARFNPDGSIDDTFSSDGVAFARAERDQNSYLQSLVVQTDGRILVAGESSIGIQVNRFLTDGSLDTSFGGDGRIETGGSGVSGLCRAMALQPDGKILLGSDVQNRSRFGLGRLLVNGEPDTSFSGDGWVMHDFANSVEHPEAISIQADGRIIVSGRAWTSLGSGQFKVDYAIIRVLPNGDFDSTFSADGRCLIPIETQTRQAASSGTVGPWHVARPDGKILLGGWYPNNAGPNLLSCLVRLDINGELDATFSDDGIKVVSLDFNTYSPFRGFVAQPDGKVLATLSSGIARFIVDEDTDGDGADDSTELALGTNINDRDSDDDGLEDGPELSVYRSNPLNPDTDNDGLLDGIEIIQHQSSPVLFDSDFDGLGDYAEVLTYGTNPARADSDGDGLTDSAEIQNHLTNPNIADTDNDGLSDGTEINTHGTNPKIGDSDADGFLDGYEVLTGKSPLDDQDKPALVAEARTAIEFTFPAAIGKTYRIEASTNLATWQTVESGIAGQGGQIQRFYSTMGMPKRYFRVEED